MAAMQNKHKEFTLEFGSNENKCSVTFGGAAAARANQSWQIKSSAGGSVNGSREDPM